MSSAQSLQVREAVLEHFEHEFMFLRPDLKLDAALDLLDAGILDSLGILRVTAFVEETFDVRLARQDLVSANFRNLEQIVAMVVAARARTPGRGS